MFIVLYLLLRRHHDIMAAGKKVILHPKELFDATSAIQLVKDAFDYRAQDLIGNLTLPVYSAGKVTSDPTVPRSVHPATLAGGSRVEGLCMWNGACPRLHNMVLAPSLFVTLSCWTRTKREGKYTVTIPMTGAKR